MLKYEYAREALKTGLKLESELGVNPYKFGMVGSTNSHTSLSAIEEENFFGKHSGVEPEPHRWEHVVIAAPDPELNVLGWQQAASGLAVVWAAENTREAIFDAMQRKETYATTGTADDRALLRRLGLHRRGRHLAPAGRRRLPEGRADGRRPAHGARGQGADLPRRGAQGRLQRQPRPHPDRQGLARRRGRRPRRRSTTSPGATTAQPGADGRLPPVGNTVDVARATWTNTIGDPELIAVWTDPDFDPALSAFYYAKVIEIPTPRWTAYEALRFGLDMPDDVPMTTQERAYTSPIWYTPS